MPIGSVAPNCTLKEAVPHAEVEACCVTTAPFDFVRVSLRLAPATSLAVDDRTVALIATACLRVYRAPVRPESGSKGARRFRSDNRPGAVAYDVRGQGDRLQFPLTVLRAHP